MAAVSTSQFRYHRLLVNDQLEHSPNSDSISVSIEDRPEELLKVLETLSLRVSVHINNIYSFIV